MAAYQSPGMLADRSLSLASLLLQLIAVFSRGYEPRLMPFAGNGSAVL